jgi:hypothetical protein
LFHSSTNEELQGQLLRHIILDLENLAQFVSAESGVSRATPRVRQARNRNGNVFSVALSITFSDNKGSVIVEEVSAGNITLAASMEGVITFAQGPIYRVLGCLRSELLGASLFGIVSKQLLAQLSQEETGVTTELAEYLHRDHLFPCVLTSWQPSDLTQIGVRISPVGEHAEAFVIYSVDGTIVDANVEFRLLTGLAQVLAGMNVASFFLDAKPLMYGHAEEVSSTLRHRSGSVIRVAVSVGVFNESLLRARLSRRIPQRSHCADVVCPPAIGPYRLGRALGSGFFGTIWQAAHKLTKECVVVKRLRKEAYALVSVIIFYFFILPLLTSLC